jgi:stress response protein SCP2
MARYFFHVIGAESAFRDEAGQSFKVLSDAEAHAAVIAAELSRKGENYQGFAICVSDEEGRELARVPIAGDAN